MLDNDEINLERAAWSDERPVASNDFSSQPRRCWICDPKQPPVPATSYCPKCNKDYCNTCWAEFKPHERGDAGHAQEPIEGCLAEDLTPVLSVLPHCIEKWTCSNFSPMASRRLQGAFDEDKNHQDKNHQSVLETLWLAVTTSGSQLSFKERPRFRDVMEQHRQLLQQRGNKTMTYYPRLISFVGNTGCGKSSLIKVLLRRLWKSEITDNKLPPILIPVAGSTNDSLPTSSDIHLFHDLIETEAFPDSPLLYADCEGFGASNYSTAANSRTEFIKGIGKKTFESAMRFMERNVPWSSGKPDRAMAVEELFPRIVYNVSDVVIYVVAEIKSMSLVLEKLVAWSRMAEMSSVNKTSLPSLIILINKCDPAKTKQWGADETTEQILKENAYLMQDNKVIKNRKEELAKFCLPHESIKDILGNSYAAVRFLRLPTANDAPRMRLQVQELYAMISSLTKTAHDHRREANMLLSPEQLHHLHQLSFDHFCKSTASPFNFMQAFFTINPSPAGLSDNFFQLLHATFEAAKAGNQTLERQALANTVISAVVPLICSTIAMDSRQRKFPGLLQNIITYGRSDFDPSDKDDIRYKVREGSYEQSLENALQKFADSTLPCGYTRYPQPLEGSPDSPSSEEVSVCINGKKAHSSTSRHQDAKGVHFGTGEFDGSFVQHFQSLWGYAVYEGVKSLNTTELPGLWDVHRSNIKELYNLVPELNLGRLVSCLWCLRNIATERLSCGHWICPSCVVGTGRKSKADDRVLIVDRCDQHPIPGVELSPPLEYLNLPKTVGRRILSLDDGGVRGIFQLEILAAMQEKLGKEIAVQDCFDLIGGSGIGGIHALGMGLKGWEVSSTIERFKKLVPKALKKPQSPSFLSFAWWQSRVPCSLDNLVESIEEAFGNDSNESMASLLSGRTAKSTKSGTSAEASKALISPASPIRVFVTSFRIGSGGVSLTNYRRDVATIEAGRSAGPNAGPQKKQEVLEYAEIYSIKEAAKATACFTQFFGTCTLSPGNHEHAGGADYLACPAEAALAEAKSLWPQMLDGRPDVLVSVGCGHKNTAATSGYWEGCTNTGILWHEAFMEKPPEELNRHYIRLCHEFPDMKLPRSYDVSILQDNFKDETLNKGELDDRVERVVHRLISTIFYFEKTSTKPCKQDKWMIEGHIRCRFKETSRITKAFGHKICALRNPRFIRNGEEIHRIEEAVLEAMVQKGRFHVPLSFGAPTEDDINIQFMADDFDPESISGCCWKY